MGKSKKKFIDPANSQHFHLVHRSQRDVKCDDPDAPQFVLLPGRRGNAAAKADAGKDDAWLDGQEGGGGEEGKIRWRDHVNELGLPNDGYDYSRHLKTMGGGRFIAASGEMGHALGQAGVYELPEDPEHWGKKAGGEGGGEGGNEVKPVVEAITLSADCMDEDMEAALFGDEDEEGGFEELLDDFVLTAGKEPEPEEGGEGEEEGGRGGEAFDFEAHMARLIEKSEKSLGWAPARGWEEGELQRLERLPVVRKGLVYDDDEEEESEEEEENEEERRKRLAQAAARRRAAMKMRSTSGIGGVGTSAKERARVEEDFADLLAEYSDEEIGELDDPAEEDATTRGVVEVEKGGGVGEAYLENILDDFLRARISESEGEGEEGEEEMGGGGGKGLLSLGRKGNGLFAAARRRLEEEEEGGEEGEEEEEEVLVQGSVAVGGAGGGEDADDNMEEYIVKHDYLGDRDPGTPWDCETILSTCSNLDNHPSIIKETPLGKQKKNNKKGNKHQLGSLLEGEEEGEEGMYGGPGGAVTMVALSRKSGLPLGVLPAGEKGERNGGANVGVRREKGETAEEKKARKAAVKMARQESRLKKKEVAQVYKQAEKVAQQQARNPEGAVSRSVFQYS